MANATFSAHTPIRYPVVNPLTCVKPGGKAAGTMRGLFIAFLLVILACAANAAEQSRNAYYPVKGKTAAEIYANIRSASPRIEKGATFAFTRIATKTDSKLDKSGGACRYKSFKTSGFFIFVLPQHQSPEKLADGLRSKWLNFVDYLQRHEQGHRDLWVKCLADYDAGALGLQAASCEELDAQREQLFNGIKRRCVGQDEAFDVIFRKEVLREPFMREALKKERQK